MKYRKPPLGLKPRFIHEEERRDGIKKAVVRMFNANEGVSVDWIREYNEIVHRSPVLRERQAGEVESWVNLQTEEPIVVMCPRCSKPYKTYSKDKGILCPSCGAKDAVDRYRQRKSTQKDGGAQ
jgi:DNA-directed RNA polymerase subunit RPC12/RpoP